MIKKGPNGSRTISFEVTEEQYESLKELARANNHGVEEVLLESALGHVRHTPKPYKALFDELLVLGLRLRAIYERDGESDVARALGKVHQLMDKAWELMGNKPAVEKKKDEGTGSLLDLK